MEMMRFCTSLTYFSITPPIVSRLGNLATRSLSTSHSPYKIAVIPADGIGKEVMPAAQLVVEALKAPVTWVPLEAGFELFERTGTSLPEETIRICKEECDGALFGSVSSPSHKVEGYTSPIVALRYFLDLYANIRPIFSAPISSSVAGVNAVIVRENTECLYVRKERIKETSEGKVAIAKRLITEKASKRIAHLAYEIAEKRASLYNRPGKVTIVHKSNVLKITDGLFRESCLSVAKDHPSITTEEQLIDSCVYRLFRTPQSFDVIVAPNMYGDILSDGGAAVVGGLGLVASCNQGDKFVMGEPVHGSAPDIYGKGIANPIAMIRSAGLLLESLGEGKIALAIERAVHKVMIEGKVTSDLGGTLSTMEAAEAVAKVAQDILSTL